MTDRGPELEATPARQAQDGTGLRWVLRISLALIVVAFAAIWVGYAHHGPSHGGQLSADQRLAATTAPGSVPPQAGGGVQRSTGG